MEKTLSTMALIETNEHRPHSLESIPEVTGLDAENMSPLSLALRIHEFIVVHLIHIHAIY